jgi:hypothetical protein
MTEEKGEKGREKGTLFFPKGYNAKGALMDLPTLQRVMLKILQSGGDTRLGRGQHYLADAVRRSLPDERVPPQLVLQTIWALVAQRLAYIDFSQSAPDNWYLRLTDAGNAAVLDEEFNPDDPSGYLSALMNKIPEMSSDTKTYASEAIHAYNAQLYLASSVMLGVASEAAFLELAWAFAAILEGKVKTNLENLLARPNSAAVAKFNEFRKRLETYRPRLPAEFADGLDLWLSSVLDLLRTYRNDAGHPTGRRIDRSDCFINLRCFARYAEKMYRLKSHFESIA